MDGEEFMDRKYRGQKTIETIEKIVSDFTAIKRSNNYRDHFFPALIDALNLKNGVEIGTDVGQFAVQILEKSKIKKLHCIDPWIDNFGTDYTGTKLEDKVKFDKIGENRQASAIKNLKKFIDNGRCVLCKGTSAEIGQNWSEPIDFLYIDGDHSLEGIYTDLYLWTEKVREGGIIAGHDYKDNPNSGMKDYFGNSLPNMVKTVTDNFCNQYGFKVHPVGMLIKSFWFVRT